MVAQTTTVEVLGRTQTQAVIHVQATAVDGAPFAGSCSYRVSEGTSFVTTVNDVNATLFTGSNLDSRVGSVNLFSRDRYFVLGTRIAQRAADGKYYSRALQVATPHWVGVKCGNVAETITTFVTQNIPLGNAYPELPLFDASAFGNRASPSIDYLDKSKVYIDPMTGVLIKRVTGPLEVAGANSAGPLFTYARDVNGGAWTNVANAMTNQNSSTLASTSTPNAPLFLAWPGLDASNSFDIAFTANDVQLKSYGGGGAVIQACISLDTGISCATDTFDITLPAGAAGVVNFPTNFPSPMFAGWGVQSQVLTKAMVSSTVDASVSVTGRVVTWTGGYGKFYAERAVGSKFLIPGTAPACAANVCTFASLDTSTQITIQESVTGTVTATMRDLGPGIRLWMKAGSAPVNASFTYDHQYSYQNFGASNADLDTCSPKPVTNIQTDRLGVALAVPQSGYLCSMAGNALILFIPATGESRLLSVYYQQGVGRMLVSTNPFSSTDKFTLFATNSGNSHLYRAVYAPATPGVYLDYVPGNTGVPIPDQVTWTDLTISSSPVATQLAAYGGPAATAFATNLFPALAFVGVIGGYTIYDATTSDNGPCIKVRTVADTNNLVQAFNSFAAYPLRWGGCHSSPTGSGPFMTLTLNPIQNFSTSTPLGGPFVLNVTQMKHGAAWVSYTIPITGANNANPVVLNAVAHSMTDSYSTNFGTAYGKGPLVTIAGGTGSWAAVNGTWNAAVSVSLPDSFTIPVDTTTFGALSGALTFTTTPPLIHSRVSSITTTTPATVVTSVDIPPTVNAHRFIDGDAISFGKIQTQFYAKVTGYSANTFGVFSDAALTSPVSGTILSNAVGGSVYFAETCPSGLPVNMTTAMTFDSIGAVGARCITLRVNGEPCSSFATVAEHGVLPCKSDASNTLRSSLQDMAVGDAIRNVAKGAYDETMVLVKKVFNSANNVEATFVRFYGNLTAGGDDRIYNSSANMNNVGWTPYMVPSNSHSSASGWIDATDTANTWLPGNPAFSQSHSDFGYGNAPGLVTFVGSPGGAGASGAGPDPIVNKTLQGILNTALTYTQREDLAWANSPGSQFSYNAVQSYPGHRQLNAALPADFNWKGDWGAFNGANGTAQTSGTGLTSGVILTNIRGTVYDAGSSTTHVYKINNMSGAFDRKRTPTYAWAGKWMFRDKSGPGSLITEADMWNYCVADFAGECRPTSAMNDVFLVGSGFSDTGGYCLTNTLNVTSPCFVGINATAGWATQSEIVPVDPTARRSRRLTMGFTAPGMQWTFMTWLQSPDGKWGFFSTPYSDGLRNDFYAMKLPPWPVAPSRDSVNRTTFVNLSRQIKASADMVYARARFGYAENGPPSSFFCTTRGEACSTEIPSGSATDPYSFVGESTTHVGCSAGCTITIPTIPGRVVYFVLDYLSAGGTVIYSTPMEAIAVY